MKSKKFIPLSVLALVGVGLLAGCKNKVIDSSSAGGTGDSSSSTAVDPVAYKATISNKEALAETWTVRAANRQVEIALDPAGNVMALINAKRLVIASSDANVVFVAGRVLSAVGEGKATITVSVDGVQTDSIELTVLPSLVEPDYVSTTLADLMKITDDTDGKNAYMLQAEVVGYRYDDSTDFGDYGNFKISDGTNTILTYGATAERSALTYDLSSQKYKFTNPKTFLKNDYTKGLKIGDKVDLLAIRCDFNGQVQVQGIIRAINGKVIPNAVSDSDTIAAAEDSLFETYKVTGQITAWSKGNDATVYGNFYIKSEGAKEDKALLVYGVTSDPSKFTIQKDGKLKLDNPKDFLTNPLTKDLKIGDTVTIVGYKTSYNTNQEIVGYLEISEDEKPDVVVEAAGDTNLAVGDTLQLSASIKDGSAVASWAVDSDAVVSVSEAGLVTAKALGHAVVTATSANGKTGTIDIYVVNKEVVKTTVDALVAGEGLADDVIYEVSGILEGKVDTDNYGNGYLTDATSGKSVKIYGNTMTEGAISWSQGKPAYTNKKDATTTLAEVHNGEEITVKAVYSATYKNISVVTTAHKAHEGGVTVKAAEGIANGTVAFDKESYAYGDAVKVTLTPASGYKVGSVSVKTAYGSINPTANEDGTYTFAATQVNTVEVEFVGSDVVVSSMTITADAMGLEEQKYTTSKDATIEGVAVKASNVGNYGYLQFRYKGNAASYLYNTTATPYAIKEITITENAGKLNSKANMALWTGTEVKAEAPTDGVTLETGGKWRPYVHVRGVCRD